MYSKPLDSSRIRRWLSNAQQAVIHQCPTSHRRPVMVASAARQHALISPQTRSRGDSSCTCASEASSRPCRSHLGLLTGSSFSGERGARSGIASESLRGNGVVLQQLEQEAIADIKHSCCLVTLLPGQEGGPMHIGMISGQRIPVHVVSSFGHDVQAGQKPRGCPCMFFLTSVV